MGQPRIPDTPAGHTLRALLEAFDSGDPARLQNYLRAANPDLLSGLTSIRDSTGGYDLVSIERSEPLHIWFLVKERDSDSRTVGDIGVTSDTPPKIQYLWLSSLPPGISPRVITLDSALRGRVIDGVAADLAKFYVHPAVATQMIAVLRAHQKTGAYRDLTDGFQFAYRLTSDLRAVSHDAHLAVRFAPFKAPPPAPPTARQLAQMREQTERANCAFEKVQILPGDIGYVKFDGFMPPGICAGTIEAAMAFVAHTRALIFDLRDNGGGDPVTVAFIASYLFNHPTHLNDIRDKGKVTQYWTLPSLPGEPLATQPVFVLTSGRTFSGAEEFCYDLKNLKRATLVGATTGGGAHLVAAHVVAGYFFVGVPFAEPINPVSHTNWEGTGVEPDVKVPAADALTTAERLATRDIQAAAAVQAHAAESQTFTRAAPSPGTEASLRRQLAGWERGEPDYKDMGPGLQEATLQQRKRMQAMFNRLGALKSLAFICVGRDGSDVYEADFAHGRLQVTIAPLSFDDRANNEFFHLLTDDNESRGQTLHDH